MKTIFEMMALYCVWYIFIEYKQNENFIYRHTTNFANMVAIIFFSSGSPHLVNHPLPMSAFAQFFLKPLPPNVRKSFINGPLCNSNLSTSLLLINFIITIIIFWQLPFCFKSLAISCLYLDAVNAGYHA